VSYFKHLVERVCVAKNDIDLTADMEDDLDVRHFMLPSRYSESNTPPGNRPSTLSHRFNTLPQTRPLHKPPSSMPSSKRHNRNRLSRYLRSQTHRVRPLRQHDRPHQRSRRPHQPHNPRPLLQQNKTHKTSLPLARPNRPLLRPKQNLHNRES